MSVQITGAGYFCLRCGQELHKIVDFNTTMLNHSCPTYVPPVITPEAAPNKRHSWPSSSTPSERANTRPYKPRPHQQLVLPPRKSQMEGKQVRITLRYNDYPNFEGEDALRIAAGFAINLGGGYGFGERDLEFEMPEEKIDEFKRLALKHLHRVVYYDVPTPPHFTSRASH